MRPFLVLVVLATSGILVKSVTAQQQIKVMSYNILHGAAPGLKHTAQPVDLHAVAKVIRAQNPDLVALQEVDSMWSRSNNQFQPEVLSRLTGMPYYYYSDSRSFTDTAGWGYGVAILSKYPISNGHTLFLPYYYHPGSENWVNAVVTVTFPENKKLQFVSAHFDYLYGNNRLLEAQATNDIAEHADIPVIVAGDLNSRPKSPPITELKKAFVFTCKTCAPTFPSSRPHAKIDYILYSKNSPFVYQNEAVIRTAASRFASDHLPYVVTLEWTDR